MKTYLYEIAAIFVLAAGLGSPARAGQTNVAVAANFTAPVKEIAALFKSRTGHDVVFSFGPSGQFYEQIKQDAPFQVFLSADAKRPAMLLEEGFGAPGTMFTYAVGKLVLWSKSLDASKGAEILKGGAFAKLAIANPTGAPYGAAAIETMQALGVYDALQAKIVQGNSIAQAFQFIDTGNAELGFVALSQLAKVTDGSRWLVPQNLYKPIRQDAILLKKAEKDEASIAFLAFLKSPEARAIIEKFGYGLE